MGRSVHRKRCEIALIHSADLLFLSSLKLYHFQWFSNTGYPAVSYITEVEWCLSFIRYRRGLSWELLRTKAQIFCQIPKFKKVSGKKHTLPNFYNIPIKSPITTTLTIQENRLQKFSIQIFKNYTYALLRDRYLFLQHYQKGKVTAKTFHKESQVL